jgi:hypothetical protein
VLYINILVHPAGADLQLGVFAFGYFMRLFFNALKYPFGSMGGLKFELTISPILLIKIYRGALFISNILEK